MHPRSLPLRPGNPISRPGDYRVRPRTEAVRPATRDPRPGRDDVRPSNHTMRPGRHRVRPGIHAVRPEDYGVGPGDYGVRPGNRAMFRTIPRDFCATPCWLMRRGRHYRADERGADVPGGACRGWSPTSDIRPIAPCCRRRRS